jgi:hypothetical protein
MVNGVIILFPFKKPFNNTSEGVYYVKYIIMER